MRHRASGDSFVSTPVELSFALALKQPLPPLALQRINGRKRHLDGLGVDFAALSFALFVDGHEEPLRSRLRPLGEGSISRSEDLASPNKQRKSAV